MHVYSPLVGATRADIAGVGDAWPWEKAALDGHCISCVALDTLPASEERQHCVKGEQVGGMPGPEVLWRRLCPHKP